jgi:hypothetical protein
LEYRGRKRSHRFTILGDTAFEYDCILEKEPESNVVTLLMEGAEHFNFFRQPDFVKDPFLKGSYAVYKKEILNGEGTGKLCHIHRPEIIDSRGRRCWGDLSVAGNKLSIAIPENWLSEAKYPVVVDPSFGTETVGSQTHWKNIFDGSYKKLFFEKSLGVNRSCLFDAYCGMATAYVYAYDSESHGRCKPVLYTNEMGGPWARLSGSEGNCDITVNAGKPAGWRSATFQIKDKISEITWLWFGVFCDGFAPLFDFGAPCSWNSWEHLGNDIPDPYPLPQPIIQYNFILSMYFTYDMPLNYALVLDQRVMPSETRKLIGNYQRNARQTVQGRDFANRFEVFCRSAVQAVKSAMSLKGSPLLIRKAVEAVAALAETERRGDYCRSVVQTVKNTLSLKRPLALIRKATEAVAALGKTARSGDFCRSQQDTAGVRGAALRSLSVFIRLLTGGAIRDFIAGRFLKSKEELVVKSPVAREITLDSKLH